MLGFIEYLEELIDLKSRCTITFKADNGGVTSIQDRISDICVEMGNRLIKTAGGLKIEIRQVIEINGRPVQNFC
jgi:hypothetical protein